MIIPLWLVLLIWIIISIFVYRYIINDFDPSIKNEHWTLKACIFAFSMLISLLTGLLLFIIFHLLCEVYNGIVGTDWITILNHEVIYIK